MVLGIVTVVAAVVFVLSFALILRFNLDSGAPRRPVRPLEDADERAPWLREDKTELLAAARRAAEAWEDLPA